MFLSETLRGFQPRTPSYFLLVQKVTKNTHREGTLSMGSLPYVPHPRDDTKGGARPPCGIPRIDEEFPIFVENHFPGHTQISLIRPDAG